MIRFLYMHKIIKSNLITLIDKFNVNYRLTNKKFCIKIKYNTTKLKNYSIQKSIDFII